MTNKKEKVSSLLTVEDVVKELQWINTAIRQCHTDLRNGLRNPQESLGSLHQEKHRLILELLQRRKKAMRQGNLESLAARIKVEIRRFPGENPHPFSRNDVRIKVPGQSENGKNGLKRQWQTITFLNQLATAGLGNSLVVLERIGEPTNYLKEQPNGYVERTFAEGAVIDAALRGIRIDIKNCAGGQLRIQLEQDRSVLERVKIDLATRLLAIRVNPDLALKPGFRVGLLTDPGPKTASLVQICFGERSLRIFDPKRYKPEIGDPLANLIEAGGGYDFEEQRLDPPSTPLIKAYSSV